MRLSDYFGFCFDMKVSIAAGCFGVDGYGKNFDKQYWSLFEGATLKTTTLLPIEPEPLPIPDFIKVGDNYFNAVRLRNPGIANIKLDDLPSSKQFRLSLWANSLADWQKLLAEAEARYPFLVGYELNLSCPQTETLPPINRLQDLINQTTRKPVYFKTLKPILSLKKLVVGNSQAGQHKTVKGGWSGACLKDRPKLIADLRQQGYRGQIIGAGGICSQTDIKRYLQAGANEVQVGGWARENYVIGS